MYLLHITEEFLAVRTSIGNVSDCYTMYITI